MDVQGKRGQLTAGRVIAFEPFPTAVECLRADVGSNSNCEIYALALGAESGMRKMHPGEDKNGGWSRIVDFGKPGIEIEITSGDSLISERQIASPSVVKIDTEGFELDVLRGMRKLTTTPTLRAIFIEVHFGLLADRGMANAPAEIESLLTADGFATRWVDASHIVAERR